MQLRHRQGSIAIAAVAAIGLIALVFIGAVRADDPIPTSAPHSHMGSMTMHGASPAAGMGMPGMAMQQEFDVAFIDMMIAHHEAAIAMAQTAVTEGEHQEIRDMAGTVIADQQSELERLRLWRGQWYPDAPETPMNQMTQMMAGMMQGPMVMGGGMHHTMPSTAATPTAAMLGMMAQMLDPAAGVAAMHAAGGPFDRAFMEAMIAHHQSEVAMAQAAMQQAQHQELRDLASSIVEIRDRDMTRMRVWLRDWYGATPVADVSNAQQVDVILHEFSIETSMTEFVVGQPYRITVTNAGTLAHEFMIMPPTEGMGQMDMETLDAIALVMIHADDLPPGATQTIDVVFPESARGSEMEFVCALPGHYDAGMTVDITIAP